MICEHFKSKLNQRGKLCYESMLDAFVRLQPNAPCKSMYTQEITDAYVAVYNDHPELFYLSNAPQMAKKVGFLGNSSSIISNFIFSQGEIFQYRMAMDKIVKNLSISTSKLSDEIEIEKLVCDYILKNTTYEINNTYNQNAATVLIKGKGQCSGISKAVKFIFDYLDIECIIVDGTAKDSTSGRVGPHNWNIVNINGDYYHLDVTFMIGANMSKRQPFNYRYLNYSDSQISIDHQWDKSKYPQCNKGATSPVHPATYSSSTTQNNSPSNVTQKSISSYFEFKREIGRVFDKRESKFCFVSKIPSKDAQDLLDTLLKEAMDEAKNRNIGFSINITVQGDDVTVDIVWS